jgi:hypothetical protein
MSLAPPTRRGPSTGRDGTQYATSQLPPPPLFSSPLSPPASIPFPLRMPSVPREVSESRAPASMRCEAATPVTGPVLPFCTIPTGDPGQRTLSGFFNSMPAPRPPFPKLRQSVSLQIDGVCAVVLGARCERDVCAPDLSTSICDQFGVDPLVPLAAFDGFYFNSVEVMPHVIATVACHHGRGVFIVPASRHERPPLFSQLGPAKWKKAPAAPIPWLEFLFRHSRLTIPLEGSVTQGTTAFPEPMVAVFAEFDFCGKFKVNKRKLSAIPVTGVARWDSPPMKIGVTPQLLARAMGPRFDDHSPGEDNAPAHLNPDWVPGVPVLPTPKNPWTIKVIEVFAEGYPCEVVAKIARDATAGTFDPGFKGDPLKTCTTSNSAMVRGCGW